MGAPGTGQRPRASRAGTGTTWARRMRPSAFASSTPSAAMLNAPATGRTAAAVKAVARSSACTVWSRKPPGTGSTGIRSGRSRPLGTNGPPNKRRCCTAAWRWNTNAGLIRTTRQLRTVASKTSRSRSTYAFSRAYAAVEAPWVGQSSWTASRPSRGEYAAMEELHTKAGTAQRRTDANSRSAPTTLLRQVTSGRCVGWNNQLSWITASAPAPAPQPFRCCPCLR